MRVNGTLINYFFHCRRQCYLHGNRLNLEDNSEQVKIGRALHDEYAEKENTEIAIENICIDRLSGEYLTEVKKSDADVEAAKWQLLFYLKILKEKGVVRKGRLEFHEKENKGKKTMYYDLTPQIEEELDKYINEIEEMLGQDEIPEVAYKPKCRKCAYYEYCFI